MREQLLEKVRGRVSRCARRQDGSVVLAPAAVADAQALLDTVPDGEFDGEVAYFVGSLFWLRFLHALALPGGGEEAHRREAASMMVDLLAPLCSLDEDGVVPWPIAILFGFREPGVPEEVDMIADIVVTYLPGAIDSKDPAALDRGILLARRSLALVPADHLFAPALLGLLGAAMAARFENTARPADLDRAVDALRGAVAAAVAGERTYAG